MTELDLGVKRLTSLPAEIGQLTGLQNLHLNNNELSALPAEVGQLTGLTELLLNDQKKQKNTQLVYDNRATL